MAIDYKCLDDLEYVLLAQDKYDIHTSFKKLILFFLFCIFSLYLWQY